MDLFSPEDLEDNFSFFDDWEDRYRYILDLGKKLEALSDVEQVDSNKVDGCLSQVWLIPSFDQDAGVLRFKGDSDAAIVKGLVAVLLGLCSEQKPQYVLDLDIDALFRRIGMDEAISPNRRNGFFAMVGKIKEAATIAATA